MAKGIYDHSNHKPTLGKHWKIQDTSKMKGRHPRSEFKKGMSPWNVGVELLAITGERNWLWKGNIPGNTALHSWVKRKLGKAFWCTTCFSTINVQWANVSHEYKRDLSDWLQLCGKCHSKYDKGRSDRKLYFENDGRGRRIVV